MNRFIKEDEMAEELGISKPYAYKVIRKLNEELKAKEHYAEPGDRDQTIRLLFEGVMGRASVYVNGSLAGENNYAYSEFYVDIGRWLRYGETNQILVMVNAMDMGSRYYCGAGICRDVWLIKQGAVRFIPESLRCTTLDVDGDLAVVRVDLDVENTLPRMVDGVLNIKVGSVCREQIRFNLPGGKCSHIARRLALEGIIPWSEDTPELYDIAAELLDADGASLDDDTITTGFRVISVDAKRGLRVNGKTVKLRGACIHHDQGLLGAATYDGWEYYRVRTLKEVGFNAVRCAHNPASKALLRACDALGVYVMDEAFDMWARMKNPQDFALFFSQDWRRVLETMVRVDYSHPSVILYSTGNEITEIGTEKGCALSRAVTEYLHDLDSIRFFTNGVNGIFAAGNRLVKAFTEITGGDAPEALRGDINECMSVLGPRMGEMVRHGEISDILEHLDGTMDVLGYNYMTGRYETDCENHPNRVIIGTETYPKQIAENWAIIERIPAILGDFTWTGWDYLGETGSRENFPWLQNHSGDIDCTGERKSASYYREIVFGLREQLYVAVRSPEQSTQPRPMNPWQLTDAEPTWRFDGAEGRTVTVEVYSAGDAVELFLNGRSLCRKSADGLYAHFNTYDIPWQPGTLRAVSWRDGVQLGACELTTAGDAARWETSVEAHGDIALVTLEGRDANGLRTRAAIPGVSLALEGPAELLAFGGCESQCDAGYTAATIDVTNGRAMAILRRTGAGEISVRVRAKDMKEVAITIGE